MSTLTFRTIIVRILFVIAILTFSTGLMKFFGLRSRPLSTVHHFSGLVFAATAVCHMIINRRALSHAFGGAKGNERNSGD